MIVTILYFLIGLLVLASVALFITLFNLGNFFIYNTKKYILWCDEVTTRWYCTFFNGNKLKTGAGDTPLEALEKLKDDKDDINISNNTN